MNKSNWRHTKHVTTYFHVGIADLNALFKLLRLNNKTKSTQLVRREQVVVEQLPGVFDLELLAGLIDGHFYIGQMTNPALGN
jgi:hypothetical protein